MSVLSRRPATPSRTEPRCAGFVSPWEGGSRIYRTLVLTGSGLFLVGIVLSLVGATTHWLPLSWTALVILGLGVVVHLGAQMVRFRGATRRGAGRRPD